jgi:hypothetical protein
MLRDSMACNPRRIIHGVGKETWKQCFITCCCMSGHLIRTVINLIIQRDREITGETFILMCKF